MRTPAVTIVAAAQACQDWRMTRALRSAVVVAGLALGVFSLAVARGGAGYSFGGSSAFAGAAELAAGYALLAVGVTAWMRPRQARVGVILVAASFAWFLLEWSNPAAGSVVFTGGLVLYAAAPPLVAHAMLAYPDGRVGWWPGRLGLALAYAGSVLVLGLLAAAVFDPASEGCAQCPRNLLLAAGGSSSGTAYGSINRAGVYLGLTWSLLVILLAAGGLARSTPARRRQAAPVVVAGCAYLGLVAAGFARSLHRGFLGTDGLDRQLWLGEAAALCVLSLAVVWAWVRARRTRSALARLVIELAESPPPGGLRDVLASVLHDRSLVLAYPLAGGRLADARCQAVELTGEITPIVRGGQQVALLSHRPGLLAEPALAEEVAAAARLALENERLQSEARFQLEELRASRFRIVQSGDAERRRLVRDLHDGAQQRLVTLSLALRLARTRLGRDPDLALAERIDQAEAELRAALADLRELAQGIFPVILAEEGLSAAVEALAEAAPIPLEITTLPHERLGSSVEATAYFVVSEAVRRSAASTLKVSAARRNGHLVVEVEGDSAPAEITDLQDRVGALDGSVAVVQGPDGRAILRAEIPCEW
jgi:signal transduction histidine kinase